MEELIKAKESITEKWDTQASIIFFSCGLIMANPWVFTSLAVTIRDIPRTTMEAATMKAETKEVEATEVKTTQAGGGLIHL